MRAGITRWLRAAALVCLLLCVASVPARGETKIDLVPEEWTWEPGDVATFHGSILPDQDLAGAVLSLTAETRLEQSGEAIFTSLNGKKLKIRKQGPSVEADLSSGAELPFEADWTVPEDTGAGLGWAKITLRILSPEGAEIASGALEMGSLAEENAKVESSPSRVADRVRFWLIIGSAAVWCLALGRYLIVRAKAKKG